MEIAAIWRYRLPIKNLTPHYSSQFVSAFFFVVERGRGEKKEKAGRSRSSSGATNFGATDMRYREVKTCPKLL